ncbi:MAG: ribonuclease HI [Clostridia bacterium]|jgi:ribonuclease HI|nr:ribonuclease HI [Clostridia bacterium]
MDQVTIYTDGACSHNPGPGGWGCVLIYGKYRKEASGSEPMTTNNRMEVTAAIEALRFLKRPCIVDLYTDSAYLCNAFEKNWLKSWQKNNWKTASKKDVENRDLWETLLALCTTQQVRFHKVKGHADNAENNRCDALARAAIQALLKEQKESTN